MPRRPSDHVDSPERVGERLRAARKQAGLSQRDLSFSGCTTAYISRIEAGKRIPSLQILREFGRRLQVSAEYLATGREEQPLGDDPVLEAELLLRLDDPQTARERLVEIVESATDEQTRARALAGLGHVAFDGGSHEEAIELFQDALRAWPALEGQDPSLADSLGRAYAMTSRYEEAIAIFERRLAHAREREDLVETVRFSVLLGNALVDRGRFGHAEEVIAQAITLTAEARDPLMRARVWWTQARLHTLRREPVLAEKYAQMALNTLAMTEHVRYAAAAHQTLALIKLDQDDPEAALDLLDRGFPLVLEGGNGYQQGLFRAEQARALVRLGRLDEAEDSANRALGFFAGASAADASRVRAVLAEIHEERGEIEEAIGLYRQAADDAPVTARYKVETYARLADLLKRVGRTDEALEVLTQAVSHQVELAREH